MSFWSGETLRKRLPSIVRGYSEDLVDCNAYTMRLGKEIYISPSKEKTVGAAKMKLECKFGEAIPPGQFAFLLTEEYVEIPRDAMAFISIRSTQKFRGLVNVSGFHIDPGYRGRLVFAVFNASANYIHLHRGDPCFLMWFANLDGKSDPPNTKTDEGFVDIPSKLINPLGGGKIESLNELSERISRVEGRLTTLTAIALLVAGVAVSAAVGQCREAGGRGPAPITVVVPSSSQGPAVGVEPPPSPLTVPPPEAQPQPQLDDADPATLR